MADTAAVVKEPYVPTEADFKLKNNTEDILVDSNFASQSYWKGVMMKPVNQSVFEYIGPHSITKNSIGANSVFAMAAAPESDGSSQYKITRGCEESPVPPAPRLFSQPFS